MKAGLLKFTAISLILSATVASAEDPRSRAASPLQIRVPTARVPVASSPLAAATTASPSSPTPVAGGPAAYSATAGAPVPSPQQPFPAPPPNATPDQLQQAMQSFMNYLNGVDQSGNPAGFPDWESPSVVGGRSRAPALPSVSGEELSKNCGRLPAAAVEKMRNYLKTCDGRLDIRTGKVAINDFSTDTPVMYILDKDTLNCEGSTRVSFGVGSHGNPPTAGNGGGSHMTPAGFHITTPHHGSLYQEWNSIGITGMGSENSKTKSRGVIIHPSRGHTLGCVGIPSSRFMTVKSALDYGSVVLNYFPGQIGDSQNRCPRVRSAASNSKSSSGRQ